MQSDDEWCAEFAVGIEVPSVLNEGFSQGLIVPFDALMEKCVVIIETNLSDGDLRRITDASQEIELATPATILTEKRDRRIEQHFPDYLNCLLQDSHLHRWVFTRVTQIFS